ncbi:Adenylyl-sulfate kinase [Ceratobasidium sp. 394]|nr:Adenylyl-sulfate kinase [Ceratobasidium sp. 394]
MEGIPLLLWGQYKLKAHAGMTKDFTSKSVPYEAPENPEIQTRTDQLGMEDGVRTIVEHCQANNYTMTCPNTVAMIPHRRISHNTEAFSTEWDGMGLSKAGQQYGIRGLQYAVLLVDKIYKLPWWASETEPVEEHGCYDLLVL